MNWEQILWISGGLVTFFLSVITGLLAWIGSLNKKAAEKIELRMDGQDTRLAIHDKEIHDIALSNREILTVMKHKFKIK